MHLTWHDLYIYIRASYVNVCTDLKENEFISALEACKRLVVRLGWGNKLSYDVKCHLFWNKMMNHARERKRVQRGRIPRQASKGTSIMVPITQPSTFHIGQHGGFLNTSLTSSVIINRNSKHSLIRSLPPTKLFQEWSSKCDICGL
jgi:hypothetical protein